MLGYDVQLKGFNRLDELSARLIVPLRDAAVVLANAIKTRVRNGVSPTGGQWTPLGEYSTTGRGKDDKNRWWVAPGQPQPAGYERKVQQGQWQGWVVYENYGRYLELLPNGKRRDWDKTGRLWASLGVRAMAVNRVKISFYGSRGKGASASCNTTSRSARPLSRPSRRTSTTSSPSASAKRLRLGDARGGRRARSAGRRDCWEVNCGRVPGKR